MCHGLIEQRVCNVSVPDLLRTVSYQELDYDKYAVDVIDYPSVDVSGSDSLLPKSGLVDVNDYHAGVKKFDSESVYDIQADTLSSTGFLTTWYDCIKSDDFLAPREASGPTKLALVVAEVPKDTCMADEVAPKSRKARKSEAVKEQTHAQHDSAMEYEDPVLVDEKRKRRMSSNRASAQRSRQRKQDRLDELEILTAQLRLENATLTRRAKIAEELAKKFQIEKTALSKKMEELEQELEAARRPRAQGSADSEDESKDVNSEICHIVDRVGELEASSKGRPENLAMNPKVERNLSCTALYGGSFQELFEAINSDQFDVNIGDEVPDLLEEEWIGSFTDCLNA